MTREGGLYDARQSPWTSQDLCRYARRGLHRQQYRWWTDLEPGSGYPPLQHAVARLAVSATQPQHAYLAAYEAGIYRSDDGGQTWQHLSSYPSPYAHSVLVHPQEPHILYVGSEPAAVFRSHDSGATWEECASFRAVPEAGQWFFHSETRQAHVRDLRMAPHDASRLYAGIEVGGVVGSRDGSATWQQLPGTHDDIHCIHLSAAQPQTVYVATA